MAMPAMTRYDDPSLLKIESIYDTPVHVYASLSNIFVFNVTSRPSSRHSTKLLLLPYRFSHLCQIIVCEYNIALCVIWHS